MNMRDLSEWALMLVLGAALLGLSILLNVLSPLLSTIFFILGVAVICYSIIRYLNDIVSTKPKKETKKKE